MSTLAYNPSRFDFANQGSFDSTTARVGQSNRLNFLLTPINKQQKKQELLIVDKGLKFHSEGNIVVNELMSDVKSAFITNELRSFPADIIPNSSPIYSLQDLEIGWDGYGAEPLSQEILLRANQIWNEIKKIIKERKDLPRIYPTANGSVAFSWTQSYPQKELEVSLIDNSTFFCEWLLSDKDEDEEGSSASMPNLCKVIRKYMEL